MDEAIMGSHPEGRQDKSGSPIAATRSPLTMVMGTTVTRSLSPRASATTRLSCSPSMHSRCCRSLYSAKRLP